MKKSNPGILLLVCPRGRDPLIHMEERGGGVEGWRPIGKRESEKQEADLI